MERAAAVLAEIEVLRASLDSAGDALLTAAEKGLAVSSQDALDREQVTVVFTSILELCSFHDLAGQRLSRIAALIAPPQADARPDAELLHGPADSDGLDQDAADALFATS